MRIAGYVALGSAVLLTAPAYAGGGPGRPLSLMPPTFRSTRDTDIKHYENQSVRQDMRLAAATRTIRVRLTNELGTVPLVIGKVSVAQIGVGGTLGVPVTLTFGGRTGVTIAPGAPAFSDTADLAVPAFGQLAVTVLYPTAADPVAHRVPIRISQGSDGQTQRSGVGPGVVTAVESADGTCGRVVVALGDSITEGAGSTPGHDWPSDLAHRLDAGRCAPTVVNAGIGGNKILSDGGSPALLARFDRDVLSVPGVTDIIFLEGINDIRGWEGPTATATGSAADVISAYRQIVARAHAHGIRVFGGTLTPYGGAKNHTDAGAAIVEAVNAAIRKGDIFDGVVEFSAAVADPKDGSRMQADMQKGDWLHPNDKGYAAMAAAVPAGLFAASPR